jgi:hypothetical protein
MDVSGESIRLSISLRLAVDFVVHVMCIKDKQVLVFNFVTDLLWTGCGIAYLGYRGLQ